MRRESWINYHECRATLFDFVGEDGFEAEPSLVEDRAIETGLLTDQAPRLFERSSRASRHVPNEQVFERDVVEAACDIERRLVAQGRRARARCEDNFDPRLRREAMRWERQWRRPSGSSDDGMGICSPIESVSVFITPRSTPTLGQMLIGATCSISQTKLTCQPNAARETMRHSCHVATFSH